MKIQIQAVRLFSVHRNHAEVHRQLVSEHGDNAISVRTIARVNNQFDELGHVLKKDIPGRPRSARSEENENKILQQIHDNGRTPMSSRRLSSVTGISRSTVLRLLHDMKVKPYIPRLIHVSNSYNYIYQVALIEFVFDKISMNHWVKFLATRTFGTLGIIYYTHTIFIRVFILLKNAKQFDPKRLQQRIRQIVIIV